MHGIAGLGAAEMGEPGAGDQAMRRIGMVERGEHAAVRKQVGQIDHFGVAGCGGKIGERATFACRLPCQLVGGVDAGKNLHAPAVVADPADPALAVRRYELHQTHRPAPPLALPSPPSLDLA